MKCEKCKKDIPLQYGFDTNSVVLKPRTDGEIIITPLCDECATNIFFIINYWLNKEEEIEPIYNEDGEQIGTVTQKELEEDMRNLMIPWGVDNIIR